MKSKELQIIWILQGKSCNTRIRQFLIISILKNFSSKNIFFIQTRTKKDTKKKKMYFSTQISQ